MATLLITPLTADHPSRFYAGEPARSPFAPSRPLKLAKIVESFNRCDDLERAFIAGVVLSGDVDQTENALLGGVQELDLGNTFREAILQWVALAAVSTPFPGLAAFDADASSGFRLPEEYIAITSLPLRLRQCLGLHLFLGWTRDICGAVLSLDPEDVDLRLQLALMQDEEEGYGYEAV